MRTGCPASLESRRYAVRAVISLMAPHAMWSAQKSGQTRERSATRRRLQALQERLLSAGAGPLAERMAGGLEEPRQREPVERLLVEPAGEERRDVRLVDGPGRQELPQVDDGVRLDVLHVAEGPDRLGADGMPRDVGPGEGGQLDRTRARHVGLEVHRGHGRQPTTIRLSRVKGTVASCHPPLRAASRRRIGRPRRGVDPARRRGAGGGRVARPRACRCPIEMSA